MEIWALIISIASLMISTFFTLWNTRPHIKIKADFSGYSVSLKMIVVTIRYSNASSVAGTISGAYILIENQKIPCLEIFLFIACISKSFLSVLFSAFKEIISSTRLNK